MELLQQQCYCLREVGQFNPRAGLAYSNIASLLSQLADQPFARSSKECRPSPACEMLLTGLQNNLHICFSALYLTLPARVEVSLCQRVALSAVYLRNMMRDFVDFLEVKARRNLAATSLQSRFPGLVHFIWVDRRSDELVCSSPDFEHMPAGLTARMWHGIIWCKREAHKKRAQTMTEDATTNRQAVTVLFRRERTLQYSLHLIPDSLSAPDSPPNEFCMVHLGCVPTIIINQHQALIMARIRERTRSSIGSLIE